MSAEAQTIPMLDFPAPATPQPAALLAIESDGRLRVRLADGRESLCDWLEGPATAGIELVPGDRLLVQPPAADAPGVVLGRIGRYRAPQPAAVPERVVIEAGQSLVLKCGEAAVELRADGKLAIRGEDILLRAQRTQRIKAGTVSIN